MEMDQGKVFIGGISWDTNEDRLKKYFGAYGEVVEAVIMRDRATGRARGFGFVVFAAAAVAERVVKEKHIIDGRTVEAKKAVPKDDQHLTSRSISSIQGSPRPGQTRKIFVGGLASTVTESDFKKYFDQFGTTMDVVVMYDHNTHRPRGFGFITYDSEDAVDRALHKTFHELNGKMVEVKRAVPKELSLGSTRGPVGYNYVFSRANNFINNYAPGYNMNPTGGYRLRMDGRYSPLPSNHVDFSHLGSPYRMDVNVEQTLNSGFGSRSNFSGNLGNGHDLNPYFGSNQAGRYNASIGYIASNGRSDSFLNSPSRDVWGNGAVNTSSNNANTNSYFGSGIRSFGVSRNNEVNWGSSPFSTPLGGDSSGYGGGSVGYRGADDLHAPGVGGFARNDGTGVSMSSSFAASNNDYEGSYRDLYGTSPIYGTPTWQPTSPELDNSASFGYGLGNPENVTPKDPKDYGVSYNIPNRQTGRGIAA